MGTEIKGYSLLLFPVDCREDGSPSWGRKSHIIKACICVVDCVEKMGPRRGDGNSKAFCPAAFRDKVEKMDPLRGGGNKIRAASFGI